MLDGHPIYDVDTTEKAAQITDQCVSFGWMPQWVVYQNTSDYPGEIVARLWVVGRTVMGKTVFWPSQALIRGATLDIVRRIIPQSMALLDRDMSDDPTVVEVWL
jgi:hypothetical protein